MINFTRQQKEVLVPMLQKYFDDELGQELGSFDAEFLLDFLSEKVGAHFYNQGLNDALKTIEAQVETISDNVYQLEQDTSHLR